MTSFLTIEEQGRFETHRRGEVTSRECQGLSAVTRNQEGAMGRTWRRGRKDGPADTRISDFHPQHSGRVHFFYCAPSFVWGHLSPQFLKLILSWNAIFSLMCSGKDINTQTSTRSPTANSPPGQTTQLLWAKGSRRPRLLAASQAPGLHLPLPPFCCISVSV